MMGSQMLAFYLNNYFPSRVKPICSLDLSYTIISGIYMLPQKTIMLEKAGSALAVFLSARSIRIMHSSDMGFGFTTRQFMICRNP